MSQFPQIVIKHAIGNIITIPNQIESKAFTYISSNILIGVTTVPVDNAIDFSSGNILVLLSSMGAENCEILAASAHTDSTITTAATKQLHNRGDLVKQISFDQIVVKKSATLGGSYVDLVTQNIQVTQQNTIVLDSSGLTTDYYKVQWKNSQTAGVSSLSDPISVLVYPENSVAEVIYPVLRAMGISENDTKINAEFCLSAIDDARKYTKAKLFGIRHAWNQKFEFPIKVLAGNNYVELPDDIDFNDTDRSTLAARFLIGNILAPFNLRYIDKRTWNQVAFSVMGGTNQSVVSIGGATITLDSVGDFPDVSTGVAYVATDDYNQTIMEIEYTGVDLVNNQLTGVTGVTRAIPAGTRVWSNPTISQPIYYTVFEGRLYFDRLIPDSMQGNNLYIDYYKKTDKVTDLYQELPENYREIYKWYLRYAVKYRKDINIGSDDPDLKKFEGLVQALFDNLYTGQDTTIITS
jgi:hypothetical protein